MLRHAGSYHVIGCGGLHTVPTIDTTSTEVSFVGNLVGTYNDVAELMTLTAAGMLTTSVSSRKQDGRWPFSHARRSPPR